MATSLFDRAVAVISASAVVLVTVSVLGFGIVAAFNVIWGDRLVDEHAINGTVIQGALFTGSAAFLHWVIGFVTVPIALIGGAALSYAFNSDAHGYHPDRLMRSSIVLVCGSISLGGIILLNLLEWVEVTSLNVLGACIMGICVGAGPAWLGAKVYLLVAGNKTERRPR